MKNLRLSFLSTLFLVSNYSFSHTDYEKMILAENNFDFSKDMVLPTYTNSVLKNITFNLGSNIPKPSCSANGSNPVAGVSVAEVGAYCSLSGEGPKLKLAKQSVSLSFWHSKGKDSDHFKLVNTHATVFDKVLENERLINKLSIPAEGGQQNIDTICKAMGYESGAILETQRKQKTKALVFDMKASNISDITDGENGKTVLGQKQVMPLKNEVLAVSEFECHRSSLLSQVKKQITGDVFYNDVTNGTTRRLHHINREKITNVDEAFEMLPKSLRTPANRNGFELEISSMKPELPSEECEDEKLSFFKNLKNHIGRIGKK